MIKTPKGLRLHIGIFGRTNVGKSSFLNLVSGQAVAITSPEPGTTTDVVEKIMELLPIGPVVLLDTAGYGDNSVLAPLRLEASGKVFDRVHVAVLVLEPNVWTDFETEICQEAAKRRLPLLAVVNKTDLEVPSPAFLARVQEYAAAVLTVASTASGKRDEYVAAFKKALGQVLPDDWLNPPSLLGDLLPRAGLAVMVVPIDFEAPKGRLILPQVQAIRDVLDHDAMTVVVKEHQYRKVLQRLAGRVDLVVCDSQVVKQVMAETQASIKCTTFSIIFARYKGDLVAMARGAAVLADVRPGDRILIAEACTHHPVEGDIGRVKIPNWLREHVGGDVQIDVRSGLDWPEDLRPYRLVIHCGGCMFSRRQMLNRLAQAGEQGVALTNYGLAISLMHGVLTRSLAPFPEALAAFNEAQDYLAKAVVCK